MKISANNQKTAEVFFPQACIVLEESASGLTQGYTGDYYESYGVHRAWYKHGF